MGVEASFTRADYSDLNYISRYDKDKNGSTESKVIISPNDLERVSNSDVPNFARWLSQAKDNLPAGKVMDFYRAIAPVINDKCGHDPEWGAKLINVLNEDQNSYVKAALVEVGLFKSADFRVGGTAGFPKVDGVQSGNEEKGSGLSNVFSNVSATISAGALMFNNSVSKFVGEAKFDTQGSSFSEKLGFKGNTYFVGDQQGNYKTYIYNLEGDYEVFNGTNNGNYLKIRLGGGIKSAPTKAENKVRELISPYTGPNSFFSNLTSAATNYLSAGGEMIIGSDHNQVSFDAAAVSDLGTQNGIQSNVSYKNLYEFPGKINGKKTYIYIDASGGGNTLQNSSGSVAGAGTDSKLNGQLTVAVEFADYVVLTGSGGIEARKITVNPNLNADLSLDKTNFIFKFEPKLGKMLNSLLGGEHKWLEKITFEAFAMYSKVNAKSTYVNQSGDATAFGGNMKIEFAKDTKLVISGMEQNVSAKYPSGNNPYQNQSTTNSQTGKSDVFYMYIQRNF